MRRKIDRYSQTHAHPFIFLCKDFWALALEQRQARFGGLRSIRVLCFLRVWVREARLLAMSTVRLSRYRFQIRVRGHLSNQQFFQWRVHRGDGSVAEADQNAKEALACPTNVHVIASDSELRACPCLMASRHEQPYRY